MTTVRGYATLEQAYLEKALLEQHGVSGHILDEAMSVTGSHLLMASGVRLAVADEDFARAREILGLPPKPLPRRATGWALWFLLAATMIGLVAIALHFVGYPS